MAHRIIKSRSEERKPEVLDVDMEHTPQKPDKKLLYVDSPDIEVDDVDKDPDWRKTPLAKRLTSINRIRPVISMCIVLCVQNKIITLFVQIMIRRLQDQ